MSGRHEKLDQFESVFRSADKTCFKWRDVSLKRGLLICDVDAGDASAMHEQVGAYLDAVRCPDTLEWSLMSRDDFDSLRSLKKGIEAHQPDLIVTWRNLCDPGSDIVHSLGVLVDELTQYFVPPVLLLPDPRSIPKTAPTSVMVVANHLTGEDRLVNKGARFTPEDGTGRLILAHIEDDTTFERYMQAIAQIPDINSEVAREKIRKKLLSEPREYIESCIEVIGEERARVAVESVVMFGHQVSEYRKLVMEHEIDILALYTKDHQQIAMHGMAYSLAVELRDVALLML